MLKFPVPSPRKMWTRLFWLTMGYDHEVLLAVVIEIGGCEAIAVRKILQFRTEEEESTLPVTEIDRE